MEAHIIFSTFKLVSLSSSSSWSCCSSVWNDVHSSSFLPGKREKEQHKSGSLSLYFLRTTTLSVPCNTPTCVCVCVKSGDPPSSMLLCSLLHKMGREREREKANNQCRFSCRYSLRRGFQNRRHEAQRQKLRLRHILKHRQEEVEEDSAFCLDHKKRAGKAVVVASGTCW